MKKVILILFAGLAIASCDLLYNQDSDSSAPLNDISISAIETTPFAKRGDIITVGITVTNSGTSTIDEEFEILLNNQTDGVTIGNNTLSSGLAPKDSIRVNYSWNTGDVSLGPHVLVAKHTFKDDNASNDSLKSTLIVSEPDITDISVLDIKLPSEIEQGKVIDVEVDIKNIGNQDVNETINLVLKDLTDGKTIGTQTLEGGFTIGDSKTFTFRWNTQEYSIGDHELSAGHDFTDGNSENDTHIAKAAISKAPVADLAVTSIEAQSKATQGDNVEVSVTVRNVGNKNATDDVVVTLRDQTDNKRIATNTLSGLDAQNMVVLTFIWNTDGASIGDHELSATHDFDDENSSNDTRSTDIRISEPPVTDLAVTSIEAPSEATQGDNVQVKAEIENLGNQDVGDAITITLVDQNDGTTIDSKTINGGLAAGAATSVTFNWNTDGASPGKHKVEVHHNLSDDIPKNDSKSIEIKIIEAIYLDIAITSIKAPGNVNIDQKVTIEVTLQNLGNRDITDEIIVTLVDQTENKTIKRETLAGGMKTGSSKTLKFEWNTKRVKNGKHSFLVSHNYADENLTNNSRTFEIVVEDD